MQKQKVIVYVDGFNFYYGKKQKGWRKYYWLNVVSFFEKFMRSDQELIEVNYFSAPAIEQDKKQRQSLFFSSNKLSNKFFLHLGYYTSKDMTCFRCNHVIQKHEEKKTDVSIATQLIGNVVKGKCDISILVSADSDLIPPLELIRELAPTHKIFVYFPPKRYSTELRNFCDSSLHLNSFEQRFKTSQLPDEVELKNGTKINRPSHWK